MRSRTYLIAAALTSVGFIGSVVSAAFEERHLVALASQVTRDRQKTKALTNLRRDVRKGYVTLLEQWVGTGTVADPRRLITLVDTDLNALDEYEGPTELRSAVADVTDWLRYVDQAPAEVPASASLANVHKQVAEVDRECELLLEASAQAASQREAQLAMVTSRRQLVFVAQFVLLGMTLGLVIVWRGRRSTERQQREALVVDEQRREQTAEFERRLGEQTRELSEAHGQLVHAEKLRAVGQLAAGIAHEINTPVQYVGDSLFFLAEAFTSTSSLVARYRAALAGLDTAPAAEVRRTLTEEEEASDLAFITTEAPAAFRRANDGVERIATIVRAMKSFAHPDTQQKAPADLNHAIEGTLVIARGEYKHLADVNTDFGALPLVPCHVGELNQVFLNLIVNAAHAIAEVGGSQKGLITIKTRHEGAIVRIEVTDTGAGIEDQAKARIFEPFFTTKAPGKGTGQGLAIARSVVVVKHQGALTFESRVGQGTTFTVVLPVE